MQRDLEHLVTGSYDGTVAVWDVRSGHGLQPAQVARWPAHGPAANPLLPTAFKLCSPGTKSTDSVTGAARDNSAQPQSLVQALRACDTISDMHISADQDCAHSSGALYVNSTMLTGMPNCDQVRDHAQSCR
jgi:WD40 repeat protein